MKLLLTSIALLLSVLSSVADATQFASPTNTQLIVEPTDSVTLGTTIQLNAIVTGSFASSGTVRFCDAELSLCNEANSLANATAVVNTSTQLTAKVSLEPLLGVHRIKALFVPTSTTLGSESEVKVVTVTPPPIYSTSIALSSTGTSGRYSLFGSLTGFGSGPLAGQRIHFLDTSSGDAEIGAAPLTNIGWTLSTPTNVRAGLAIDMRVADLNHDGHLDLVALTSDGALSILLGDGRGNFDKAGDYALGALGKSFCIADFNGDGNLDIAVVGGSDVGWMLIFLGDGNGGFQSPLSQLIESYPTYIAASDFDGDNHQDLAVGSTPSASGKLSIFLGNNDGTFQAPDDYVIDQTPSSIAIADLGGTGHTDIAVAYNMTAEVTIFRNNGDGTFQPKIDLPTSTFSQSVQIADLNHDGILDLVTANGRSVGIFWGQAPGIFRPLSSYSSDVPWNIAIGDFNGDGNPDLAYTIGGTGTISVMINNGNESFQTPLHLDTKSVGYSVQSADLNGDGISDLIGGDYQNMFVQYGQQTGSYRADPIAVIGSGTHYIMASYQGDASHLQSQSIAIPLEASQTASSVTLSANKQEFGFGDSAIYVVSVGEVQGIVPNGTIELRDNGNVLATGQLVSGIATFDIKSLTVGSHEITAEYSGDSNYLGSTSNSVAAQINRGDAHLTIRSSINPAIFGSPVTFYLVGASGATGSVTLLDGPEALGTVQLVNGTASLSVSTLSGGQHTISAIYSGDNNYQ